MSEEDLKAIIASYQQKSFELFNQNIVLECQINSLNRTIESLANENRELKESKSRKVIKDSAASDFQ